jgi:hypothetical protein
LEEGIKKVNDKISDRMKHIMKISNTNVNTYEKISNKSTKAAYIPLSAAAYIPLSAGGGWRLPGVVISFTNYSYCFVFVIDRKFKKKI